MNESMRQLVQVVNRLSDACVRSQVTLGLELPQICVIGGQSVGKSSVLESIVGKDFLPRGNGIVTRCPIILKCKQSEREYAEFLHNPGHIYTDFNDVRREIQVHTDRLCGPNKGITNKSISLTIHSPHVLDITLVDLPGITRVPIEDQPADIEKQTLDLVLQYVERPNVIILAVSAANVDLANSDAMKVVKKVDPHGKRTVGVITKLDIMDPGTDAKDVLCNTVFRLKLGYIGVVNRSQNDINDEVPIEEVRRKEAKFFAEHKTYKVFAERMGIPYLQQVVSRELTSHIEKTLPDMMSILKTKKRNAEEELNRLQDTVQPDNVLDRFLYEYASLIQTEIKGTPGNVHMDEIAGGARLNSLFYQEFANKLDLSNFILNDEDFNNKIETTIRNLHAINNGIFIPDQAFNALTSAIIEKYTVPVTQCVDLAGELLREITIKSGEMLQEYPRLYEAVHYLMNMHILRQEDVTKEHLIVHVNAERSFKNTKHDDYLASATKQTLPAIAGQSQVKLAKQNSFKGPVVLRLKGKDMASWIVLSPDTLKCFKSDQEDEDICLIHIDNKVRMRTENGGKEKKLVIARSDGRSITGDVKSLEMLFRDDGTLEKWIQCFESTGVLPDGEDYEIMQDPRKDKSRTQQKPATTNPVVLSNRRTLLTKAGPSSDEIDTVKQMVQSYMTVVAKTILDIVPKYVVYLLVENTENFAIRDLSSRIRTEYNLKSLLERDAEVQQRIEHLMREYSTAEDALRILKDYYAYARTVEI